MYIPNSFKRHIKRNFYDKKVEVLANKTIINEEGGVVYLGLDVLNEFFGNVSFSNFKQIQEDYGLTHDINITITTDYKDLKINDVIRYKNQIYNVTELIESDSHYMIIGTIWQQ